MGNLVKDGFRTIAAGAPANTNVRTPNGGVSPVQFVAQREVPSSRVKFSFTNTTLTMTAAVGGAASGVGQKLCNLPQGKWILQGIDLNMTLLPSSGVSATGMVLSLGTALAGNDATLTGTEADVMSSTTLGDGTLVALTPEVIDTGLVGGTLPVLGSNSASGQDLYFNIAGTFTHASLTSVPLTLNGTVELLLIDTGFIF